MSSEFQVRSILLFSPDSLPARSRFGEGRRTNYSELSPMARTFLTDMIFEGEAASPCLVSATISTKKKIIQTSLAVIVSNMIRMGFGTGLLFPCEIEAEIFSTSVAEFKEVLVQKVSTNLTVMGLHWH